MPFVYRTFERHDIGFWFEVACASLMPSFFLSSHLFSLLLFSSFRIVDQVVLSWELGFISATQSLALSLFDLVNYTSHKWQKELVFNYSYLSWFTLTRQPIEYSLLFSIFFWAKNEILLLNISNGISIVLTIFNNYFPRTIIFFFFLFFSFFFLLIAYFFLRLSIFFLQTNFWKHPALIYDKNNKRDKILRNTFFFFF